jgi:hypothetical protein
MDQALEARLKSLEDTVTAMQTKIRDLEDINAIERLQCAYGYYLEHWMSDDIIALFADLPETSATFVEGTYLGIEGVKRYFGKMKVAPPQFLHMVMQVNPVITLAGDGVRAKGRWYGYGTICSGMVNNAIDPMYMAVIYEMEYIKQDGVWKILTLAFQMHYAYGHPQKLPAQPTPEAPKAEKKESSFGQSLSLSPDIWADYNTQYGSGFIYPMHFVHPVTGEATKENDYNAQLKLERSSFKPL